MRYLLIVLLLFLACEDPMSIDIVYGCTDSTACNYNPNATTYVPTSCNYDVQDCLGVCGGNSTLDDCGICDSDLTNNCTQDDCGIFGGDGSTCNTTIRGYVYDSSGNPIENAYIFLGYEIINIARPSTTIDFSLPNSGNVNMWVENECDEIISTIIDNELLEPGYHQETWNAISAEGLTLLDGVYELHLSTDSYTNIIKIVLINFPADNSVEGEISGYDEQICFNDNGELVCEYLALTNSSGFFEFSQNCIALNHEWTATDEVGNELGSQGLGRIRLFADDGQNNGTSNYFEVDLFNGAETNIIIGD